MGRNSSAACLDCKKQYDIGYGSGTQWLDQVDTVAAFDAELAKWGYTPETLQNVNNRRVRALLLEHDGHNILWWSADYAYIDDAGALRGDYDDDLIQEGIGQMPLFVGHEDGFVPVDEFREAEERSQRDAGVRR